MKHTTMKTILAALCTAAGAGLSTCAALPAEYQQLEYIQPNGQCRIKTGVTPAWNDKTEISLPLAQPISPAHGVFWHSENGRLLLTPPENDAQRQALALSHGVPTQTTAIEIAPSPLLPMPRVIVRRSCGNAELDMLALDAVRLTLAKAGPLPLTPGASPEKPLVLIIDWRL